LPIVVQRFSIESCETKEQYTAGLLTCSAAKRLPEKIQWLKDDALLPFYELTAAGLFGIYTRFPFHFISLFLRNEKP
jgi:hypothetical protein